MIMRRFRLPLVVAAAAVAIATSSSLSAQTTTGQDDFGTGFTGGGTPTGGTQVFTSRVLVPNNQANFGFGGTPGTFGASFFDFFGITNRGIGFDVADDSAGTFPPDDFGFDPTAPNDNGNFIAMSDITNDQNPSGIVTATWTFNTTGFPYDNHRVSIDMVGYGDFESDDNVLWEVSLDGGTTFTPKLDFGLSAAQDTADILYEVTMEGGTTYGKFFTPFFDSDNWDCLVLSGPGFCPATGETVNFHPNDNGGADDDGIAFNGFILEPILGDPNNVERAVEVTNGAGTFNEVEREAYRDPLIEQLQGGLVQLDNSPQTFTFICPGSGDLVLRMTAVQNSTKEIIAIDNILVESANIGDANCDGLVNNLDILPFIQALTDPSGYAAAFPTAEPGFKLDFDGDGNFTNLDITGFLTKLGL